MAFKILPDMLCGVELRGIGRKLFQMQPRIYLLDRGDGLPLVNRAPIPQDHDMSPQMAQQCSQKLRHMASFEVVGLEAGVQAQVPVLRGHGEGGQR